MFTYLVPTSICCIAGEINYQLVWWRKVPSSYSWSLWLQFELALQLRHINIKIQISFILNLTSKTSSKMKKNGSDPSKTGNLRYCRLLSNLRPRDWIEPTVQLLLIPKKKRNIILGF